MTSCLALTLLGAISTAGIGSLTGRLSQFSLTGKVSLLLACRKHMPCWRRHAAQPSLASLHCGHRVGRNKAVPLPEQRKPGHWLETPCINSQALLKAEVPAASGFARSGLQGVRNPG